MRALIFSLIAGNISLLVAINANAQALRDRETTLEWAERRREEMVIQNAESQQLRDLIHSPSGWNNHHWSKPSWR